MNEDQNPQNQRVILEIRTARTGEETPEAMVQFLSSLLNLKKTVYFFFSSGIPISIETAVLDQRIHFYLTIPSPYQAFAESQLAAQYPKVLMSKSKDYLSDMLSHSTTLSIGQLKLQHEFIYPLRTYTEFKEVDPMGSIISVLSKAQSGDQAVIQYLLVPVGSGWHKTGRSFIDTKKTDSTGAVLPNPYATIVAEKIKYNGFQTAIRIAVSSTSQDRSKHYLQEIGHSFSSFNNPSGNALGLMTPILWQRGGLLKAMLERSSGQMPGKQILNVMEIATFCHFPSMALANIPNISWHKVILSDPPEMLPVAEGLTPEEKTDINFFAQTMFKNKPTTFGIKLKDRRRHVYIIGKTGAGKSTLIANMAISDMRNRRGFCIIDPHGDLCETVLDYVPSYRINDIVYLDPGDHERAFSLNPLQVDDDVQKELVVSGIVAIFQKLFAFSWGPRLEYILRNTLLSVIEMPNATLLMVPELLTNQRFRNKVVENLKEPVLINYWKNEFDKMPDRLRNEAMAPILNKVGQFVQSTVIRNIIKSHNSTIDLGRIMNEGKILLLNLSQGRLGEDNAALLGAMIITKIQLAAMARVNIPEAERKDFYLYVDEFQNFATSSFIKILSEARKYRLNLLLANQYIDQVPEDVRAAIFGNAGTMLSFLIGATDATYMAKEFGERFKEEDLLALGNYQAIIKLCVDNITQAPFLAHTLPLPRSITQNRQKVINSSKQRYTKIVVKIADKEDLAKAKESKEVGGRSLEVEEKEQNIILGADGMPLQGVQEPKGTNGPGVPDFSQPPQVFQNQNGAKESEEPSTYAKATADKQGVEGYQVNQGMMQAPQSAPAAPQQFKPASMPKPQQSMSHEEQHSGPTQGQVARPHSAPQHDRQMQKPPQQPIAKAMAGKQGGKGNLQNNKPARQGPPGNRENKQPTFAKATAGQQTHFTHNGKPQQGGNNQQKQKQNPLSTSAETMADKQNKPSQNPAPTGPIELKPSEDTTIIFQPGK